MSKVLIDEDVLKALIDSASFEARYYRLYQYYGDHSDRVYAQIAKAEKAIEESKEKHFSVLEWHDVKEAPSSNAERVFVEYSCGGFGFVFGHPEIIKDDPDYRRWAYMPE